MPRLLLLLFFAVALPASAQPAAKISLYIGPVPNPNGVVTPVSRDFAASYTDLQKAHKDGGVPALELVDDPARADAILSVTYRGDVDNGSTVSAGVPISMGATMGSSQHVTPTLRGRLTLGATGEGADFSGVTPGTDDRPRWSTQAKRIYQQAAAWLTANQDRLIRLRRP